MSVIRRLTVAGAFAAALVGLSAAPALAHVSVVSTDARQDGFGAITFRVPTESNTASTTKVTVQLPAEAPIASVSVKPMPGWTHKETTIKLATPIKTDDGEEVTEAVSTIEWTANAPADAIRPGEYGDFSISAGPLPKADSITFKAIQTYSDGKQVAWIEQSSGGAEPEHPAPVLALLPAADASAGHGTSAAPGAAAGTVPAASADSGNGTATAALVIGILGLLAGLVGLGVALTSRRGRGGVPAVTPAGVAGVASGAKE
jgi:uncharacterized protein YcnI